MVRFGFRTAAASLLTRAPIQFTTVDGHTHGEWLTAVETTSSVWQALERRWPRHSTKYLLIPPFKYPSSLRSSIRGIRNTSMSSLTAFTDMTPILPGNGITLPRTKFALRNPGLTLSLMSAWTLLTPQQPWPLFSPVLSIKFGGMSHGVFVTSTSTSLVAAQVNTTTMVDVLIRAPSELTSVDRTALNVLLLLVSLVRQPCSAAATPHTTPDGPTTVVGPLLPAEDTISLDHTPSVTTFTPQLCISRILMLVSKSASCLVPSIHGITRDSSSE